MQVIGEIIGYLDRQGLLGPSDVLYLRQHGFMPEADQQDAGDEPVSSDDEYPDPKGTRIGQIEAIESDLDRARRPRAGRGGVRRNQLAAAAIANRILGVGETWQRQLGGLQVRSSLRAPAS